MINYHHIGGRNGTFPLPLKKSSLLQDFKLILYDADPNCFSQMEKTKPDNWGEIKVYPYCIGGKTEKTKFNLNFHPTTNSLYRFNEKYSTYGYVSNPSYGEYILGDACKHQTSIDLNIFSLEDIILMEKISGIDFLSLDVQGAEYDVINGSKSLLEKNCIGIQLEVEFVQLYTNQKTFFDINLLLNNMGFDLIDLEIFGRCAPMSLPIGYRGLEQPLSAEAIYVKKLDDLKNTHELNKIYKGALFNLIYKKLGLCLQYLNTIIHDKEKVKINETAPLYQKFLWEIWELYTKDKSNTLPSISRLHSNQTFQDYYRSGESTFCLKDPELMIQINQLLEKIQCKDLENDSSLEVLLRKFGLIELANEVKNNRHYESKCLLELSKYII